MGRKQIVHRTNHSALEAEADASDHALAEPHHKQSGSGHGVHDDAGNIGIGLLVKNAGEVGADKADYAAGTQ